MLYYIIFKFKYTNLNIGKLCLLFHISEKSIIILYSNLNIHYVNIFIPVYKEDLWTHLLSHFILIPIFYFIILKIYNKRFFVILFLFWTFPSFFLFTFFSSNKMKQNFLQNFSFFSLSTLSTFLSIKTSHFSHS